MKKRIIAIMCACAMVVALPAMAWAAGSPSNNNTASDGKISITVDGNVSKVVSTDERASNISQKSDSEKVLASFEVVGTDGGKITFNVGTEWAGYTAKVYIQHSGSGTTEVKTAVVAADGTVTIEVDEFSIFTITVDTDTAPTTQASTDKSSTSPKTGLDMGVAGVVAVSALAAGGVAIALRKKVTE